MTRDPADQLWAYNAIARAFLLPVEHRSRSNSTKPWSNYTGSHAYRADNGATGPKCSCQLPPIFRPLTVEWQHSTESLHMVRVL